MFYQADASRVTLREFWWENKFLIWVAMLIKLFRLKPRASTDDLAVDSLHPFQVDPSRISPAIMEGFAVVLAELRQLGFDATVWHDQDDPYQATHNTLATLRARLGQAQVRVQCRTNAGRIPHKTKFLTSFISQATDGRFLVTTNGKADMAWPAEHQVVRCVGLPTPLLWQRHQARLGVAVERIADQPQLIDAAEAYHVSLRDFHLQRGVFAPVPQSEQQLYQMMPASQTAGEDGQPAATPVQPADLMERALLAELTKMHQKQTRWGPAILILAVSLLAFVLAGRTDSSPNKANTQYLLILIPVLLFHELGHYLAMLAFGYRNVRMFFIPFLGAAVSGRNYNVPGWKKAIVSLMGPLPGILLGILFVAASILFRQPMLGKIGFVALLLNGFNLLPILPLDGGWVMHALVFSRHYMLDVVFRLMAAAGLIGLNLLLPDGKMLMFMGIFMLLSLPTAFQVAKLVNDLRKEGFDSHSADGHTIPPQTALAIWGRLRPRSGRMPGPKIAAQRTLAVFEALNARPPGLAASLGFAAAYGGGLLLPLVALIGLMPLGLFSGQWRLTPPLRYSVNPAAIVIGGQTDLPEDHQTLVFQLKTDKDLQAALAMVQQTNGQPMRLVHFGRTLMVALPADATTLRQQLLDQWEKRAQDYFVERAKYRATITLECTVPDGEAGKALQEELEDYFAACDWARIAPPWALAADWPAENRSRFNQARQVLRKVQSYQDMEGSSKQSKEETSQMAAALKKGDEAQIKRIQEQRQVAFKQARQRRFAQLRMEYPSSPIVAAWEKIESDEDYKTQRARKTSQIGPLLGLWPTEKPGGALVQRGYLARQGTTLTLTT